MCGIAGYFGKRSLTDDAITKTLQALHHRGPDGQGVYHTTTSSGDFLYLINTRLSIIDLDSRANLPMKHEKGVLCFNGEIYNYRECKENIKKEHGVKFITESDTEVLLKMLITYGMNETLDQIEGMWAFAFFNTTEEKLYVSRDRFAEKPLFYIDTEDGFYFASELKALFSLLGQVPKVNYEKIRTYLFMGYRGLHQDNTTYFQDVKLLESHSTISLHNGKITDQKSFWDITKIPHNPYTSNASAIKDVKDKLLSAVELRLRSDVPIAFCMSGGVDSLTLISIAKKIFNYDVHGFTIKNLDSRYDESTWVDEAVSDLNLRHTYVKPDQGNFMETLEGMVKHRAAPISTISYYVHFLLMREIHKNGYKVSISGTGADELFTGYYDHFLFHMAGLTGDAYDQAVSKWKKFVQPFVRNPLYQDHLLFKKTPQFRDHLHQDYSRYKNSDQKINFQESIFHHHSLRNRMLNELFKEVVPVILLEDDSNAMYFSIENRSPYLDVNLFETSLQIPEEYLIQDGYSKYILREAVKGIIPEKVRQNRKKVGFNASLFELLPKHFVKDIDDHLHPSSKVFDLINRETIIKMFKDENPAEKFLFNFLCAKIFLDSYT